MSSAARLVAFLPFGLVGITAACAGSNTQRPPWDRNTITSEDLSNPNEPIEVALQRKVPGLRVTRTAEGEIALEIRGGILSGVSPQNIESIRDLRSAEAGLYGSRGGHGVIEVTTEKAPNERP